MRTSKFSEERIIAFLRQAEAGMSQEMLANRSGIFRTYLSRIEGGIANPSITVLADLATALGVNITELFVE